MHIPPAPRPSVRQFFNSWASRSRAFRSFSSMLSSRTQMRNRLLVFVLTRQKYGEIVVRVHSSGLETKSFLKLLRLRRSHRQPA